MELISQLFCLKGRYKKKILMITHAKRQHLFNVMASFVFRLGPGYFVKPCAQRHDNKLPKILQLGLS